jgi:hypothetical protein
MTVPKDMAINADPKRAPKSSPPKYQLKGRQIDMKMPLSTIRMLMILMINL